MSTALQVHEGLGVSRADVDRWNDREFIKTIKETVCKGATDPQIIMFGEICKATGLNPFLKEIWFVPGVGVMAGRDGYLRVANEHPQFDGMETRVERDDNGIPIKATCSVWRKDRSHPITCEAYYNEYKKSSQVWTTYKSAMISKVAEVLALKRSFSINGVVTEEEIGEQQPQGSREAQAEVAEQKIAEMKRTRTKRSEEPPPVHDAEFVEPPAAAPEAPAPAQSKFREMLGALRGLKEEIIRLKAPKDLYYSVIGAHGIEHANELKSVEEGRAVYREIAAKLCDWKSIQPMPEGKA